MEENIGVPFGSQEGLYLSYYKFFIEPILDNLPNAN